MNVQVLSDQVLLNHYLSGDRSAISQLIERHSRRVKDYIHMMVKDRDVADDIFQETFIKAVRVIDEGRYTDNGKFLSWILRIAHNQVIDHFRAQRQNKSVSESEAGYDVLGTLKLAERTVEDAMVCDYDNIAESVTLTAEDYVVVMTNGHSGDLIIEEQVLRSPHAYLGVVGSRSKIAFVNKTLMDRGIPEEALKAVHTPIGTPIRAVTPAEIAVSILGEVILCRAEIREGEMPAHHGCPMHG